MKTFKYRLYPTKNQREAIDDMINRHRWLYNTALQQRKTAYEDVVPPTNGGEYEPPTDGEEEQKESVSYNQQSRWLTINRKEQDTVVPPTNGRKEFANLNFSSAQRTLRRLDKAFQAFFRRIKTGEEKPGYPRFKGYNRFDSVEFTYNDGSKVRANRIFSSVGRRNDKLYIQGIGEIKVKWHRQFKGIIKTVIIQRKAGKYYACFSVEYVSNPSPKTGAVVGLDMGISNLITTSDNKFFEPPKYYKQSEKKFRRIQRSVARKAKGSKNRRKAVRILQKNHEHIANQRKDTAHRIARKLVNEYDIIVVENLNTNGMVRSPVGRRNDNHHLAKSIMDSAWNTFILILIAKAEEAGRQVIKVDPKHTSQICSECGEIVKKDLSVRVHNCPHCGLVLDRDLNAARNILARGLDKAFAA